MTLNVGLEARVFERVLKCAKADNLEPEGNLISLV